MFPTQRLQVLSSGFRSNAREGINSLDGQGLLLANGLQSSRHRRFHRRAAVSRDATHLHRPNQGSDGRLRVNGFG
ncbi:MAG: hypothetical protein ACO3B3_02450 [Cyanobium sp.]